MSGADGEAASSGGGPSGERARAVLAGLGLPASGLRLLGRGAVSEAWAAGGLVVRLAPSAATDEANFRADAGIRRRLGRLVAPPVATGEDALGPWSVDGLVEGEHPARGAVPTGALDDLGELLGALHALPTRGFGRLRDDPADLVGRADAPLAGLLTRLVRPWPLSGEEAAAHPLALGDAPLAAALDAVADEVRAVLLDSPTAVGHTDLHGGQLLVRGGRLAALLDFGDAAVGPRAWDVASLAYFHGWGAARRAWGASGGPREVWGEARRFALVLAGHRAARAGPQGRPERVGEARSFARGVLAAGL